jgi:hypothetical protein
VPGAAAEGGQALVPLVLSLILVGGVLLLLSRFLIFESTYTVVAADFGGIGIHWVSWLVGAGLPLLVAFQLLVVRGTVPWAVAAAGGLVAGAAVSQLDLVFATGAYWTSPDTSEMPGPGWWATLLGAVVLIGCAVLVLRYPALRVRPGLRSDWRAFSGVLLVAGGLVAWLSVMNEASPWLRYNETALVLAAVCLPITVLNLHRAQRVFGLAAVTVLGLSVASGQVHALIADHFAVDARATVVSLASVVVSVAGCYLAQARLPRRGSDRAAAGTAARR